MALLQVLLGSDAVSSAARILLLGFSYFVALVVYRLYFHPLAKIPGPKLAAATGWYETYYELWHGIGGQYIFKIEEWHKKYGPILRVTPDEVHISDPEFYDNIYSHGSDIDKPAYMKWSLGTPGTMFAATEAAHHRIRRASLNSFFSKRKILDFSPRIRIQVHKMFTRLEAYKGTGKVLRADLMFAAVAADIVTGYSFDRSYNFLDAPGFTSPFTDSIESFKRGAKVSVQFPWLPRLLSKLPESLVAKLNPDAIPIFQFRKAMVDQIEEIQHDRASGNTDRDKGTIFTEVLQAPLPASEMSTTRIADEAAGIVGAALETTKWALSVITFYVLSNREILARLRHELRDAADLSIPELEQLPYLMAVIQEGLRMSYGTIGRSPRIHRTRALKYGEYVLPPGTPVSTSTYIMHNNEDVFPDSKTFKPERWLQNEGEQGAKPLSRYLASFTKGGRMCLGLQLAYVEMELILAELFTRFDLELYETTQKDVLCSHDQMGVGVWEGTKGIRVLVN